jgi:hypothetical protein
MVEGNLHDSKRESTSSLEYGLRGNEREGKTSP